VRSADFYNRSLSWNIIYPSLTGIINFCGINKYLSGIFYDAYGNYLFKKISKVDYDHDK
jgi:hypothetical protein